MTCPQALQLIVPNEYRQKEKACFVGAFVGGTVNEFACQF
jgi:hypothetical protein